MQFHAPTDLEYLGAAPAASVATCGMSRANRSLLAIERFGNPVGPARALARRAMR
jgi:hypothetical protein